MLDPTMGQLGHHVMLSSDCEAIRIERSTPEACRMPRPPSACFLVQDVGLRVEEPLPLGQFLLSAWH